MRICSISENIQSEKRIAITPEIVKKYINLGLEVSLIENYGLHLGYDDSQYKELGASIIKDEKELISKSDVIVQLGLLLDDKISLIRENQTLIGVFNLHNNQDKIKNLSKKKYQYFFFRIASKNNKSTVNGCTFISSQSSRI